jgi:hypothetical protein
VSVSVGAGGHGVEVVGEDAPGGLGLLAVIALQAAAPQAVAAFGVADASFGAGAVLVEMRLLVARAYQAIGRCP